MKNKTRKRKLKIIEMTFNQARLKGITKKEYEKRIKISKSLKIHYKKYPKIRKPKKEIQKEIIIPEKRIRRQIVFNLKGFEEPYFISIRAMTINPEITERGLIIAVRETMKDLNLNIKSFSEQYLGFEETPITPTEDIILNQVNVLVEVKIKREPAIYIKKW